jgi:signal transduction histidine kinase
MLEDVRLLESTRTELLLDAPACPDVRILVKHLRSILCNLLSNAAKYRAPGRVSLVQVRAQCSPGCFVLEVQDNKLIMSDV